MYYSNSYLCDQATFIHLNEKKIQFWNAPSKGLREFCIANDIKSTRVIAKNLGESWEFPNG